MSKTEQFSGKRRGELRTRVSKASKFFDLAVRVHTLFPVFRRANIKVFPLPWSIYLIYRGPKGASIRYSLRKLWELFIVLSTRI